MKKTTYRVQWTTIDGDKKQKTFLTQELAQQHKEALLDTLDADSVIITENEKALNWRATNAHQRRMQGLLQYNINKSIRTQPQFMADLVEFAYKQGFFKGGSNE